MSKGEIRVRVVGLVVRNKNILIIEHTHNGESWWCFPGGRQEFGENQSVTLIREFREELNLKITPVRLLYIAEFMLQNEQATEFYWLCDSSTQEFEISKKEPVITNARWVPLKQLRNLDILPQLVKNKIINDFYNFPLNSEYLGTHPA